jgi:hypothetical protein
MQNLGFIRSIKMTQIIFVAFFSHKTKYCSKLVNLQATNNMVVAQVLCFVFVNQYVKELWG